ncbi:hypothetical protein SFBM_0373 [Candidatus Arthromitus sp. SFB-mouse-Japan]|uniref:YaaR family protein n=1 Tax=Candidatus Arthromitus sp. SFB-mouse TaxID=49118 RepID=UPI00021B7E0B|nr:YaaR family protein [Candidatus Arthromitus sp. SFB-mouse]EIA24592.1 hypothetical protein SFB2_076G8 [Candidatus Arthromitus sp. SFB-2]EIA24909.1 hypothetical protein SFB1_027G2 [Candidatus Arthromitus sp. SFB-1]EIA25733.1 hypothetical protein SFB3_075G5 [Candidatus Arthromitus sp. SFB-3]EIA29195.1 hypothetical protein SFB6_014G55 [Candidatus Arthromitus sp. SFB-co]EIA30420.1 hypothetical protein SFBSU_006G101 [Candidatus Arthromitus sp. SFB-mouse-SU]EIA31552.1 hypothetical protein SFB4_01
MRISGLKSKDNKNNIVSNIKVNRNKVDNLNSEIDNKFSDKSKKELKELLDSIKKKGNKVVATKEYNDVIEYKRLVKQYLNKVLDDIYSLNKFSDAFNSRYYLTVDIIDQKLKDLTNQVIGEEKDNLYIVTTIDEIQGLILDVYK